MPELTFEMHQAMSEALTRARNFLAISFPDDDEQLLCTLLAIGFADMLCHPDEVTQQAFADAANDRLAALAWQITRRGQGKAPV